jgi:hypothetical protein
MENCDPLPRCPLLRPRGERRYGRAADETDELAPRHCAVPMPTDGT